MKHFTILSNNSFRVGVACLMVMTACFSAEARDYAKIFTVGKSWEHWYSVPPSGEKWTVRIEVVGDSVIADRNYTVLKRTIDEYEAAWGESSYKYVSTDIALILGYEEDGRTYYFNGTLPDVDPTADVMNPILDMNLNDSDICKFYGGPEGFDHYYEEPVTESHLTLMGHSRKVLKANGGYWIEGIGTTNEQCWIRPFSLYFEARILAGGYLEKCYDGDELIYDRKEFEQLAGISAVVPDQMTSGENDVTIYNLQGMPVTSPKSGEIYIQHGRKLIWR